MPGFLRQPHGIAQESCTLGLSSGRELTLHGFHQSKTYKLFFGVPCPAITDHILKRAKESARSHGREDVKVVVLEPERHHFKETPGDMDWALKKHGRPFEQIPAVKTSATFMSDVVDNGEEGDFSLLKVIWFQNSFGLPKAPFILEQLHHLDWDSLATNFSY